MESRPDHLDFPLLSDRCDCDNGERDGVVDHLGAPDHVERPQLLFAQPHHRRSPHGCAQLCSKVKDPPYTLKTSILSRCICSFLFMRDRVWLFGTAYCSINNFIANLTVSARWVMQSPYYSQILHNLKGRCFYLFHSLHKGDLIIILTITMMMMAGSIIRGISFMKIRLTF